MRLRLIDGTEPDVNWGTLDHYTAIVDQQIDLLVNYTAGDGFLYRQTARSTVSREMYLNLACTATRIDLFGGGGLAACTPYHWPGGCGVESGRHKSLAANSTSRFRKEAPTSSVRCSARCVSCATTSN